MLKEPIIFFKPQYHICYIPGQCFLLVRCKQTIVILNTNRTNNKEIFSSTFLKLSDTLTSQSVLKLAKNSLSENQKQFQLALLERRQGWSNRISPFKNDSIFRLLCL